MMSDDEDMDCPLCMEEFDIADRNFRPCPCAYQICRFCWHHIKTNLNGRCPACRRLYSDQIVEFIPVSTEELQKSKREKKEKERHEREMKDPNRRQLSNVRVVQKNLVYVLGLTAKYANAESDFFKKYGKILKLVVSKRLPTTSSSNAPASIGIYVTYARKEDAAKAIEEINGAICDGRSVRASFGTTKYCTYFLRHMACPNPNCMYLHEAGDDADSYNNENPTVGTKHGHGGVTGYTYPNKRPTASTSTTTTTPNATPTASAATTSTTKPALSTSSSEPVLQPAPPPVKSAWAPIPKVVPPPPPVPVTPTAPEPTTDQPSSPTAKSSTPAAKEQQASSPLAGKQPIASSSKSTKSSQKKQQQQPVSLLSASLSSSQQKQQQKQQQHGEPQSSSSSSSSNQLIHNKENEKPALPASASWAKEGGLNTQSASLTPDHFGPSLSDALTTPQKPKHESSSTSRKKDKKKAKMVSLETFEELTRQSPTKSPLSSPSVGGKKQLVKKEIAEPGVVKPAWNLPVKPVVVPKPAPPPASIVDEQPASEVSGEVNKSQQQQQKQKQKQKQQQDQQQQVRQQEEQDEQQLQLQTEQQQKTEAATDMELVNDELPAVETKETNVDAIPALPEQSESMTVVDTIATEQIKQAEATIDTVKKLETETVAESLPLNATEQQKLATETAMESSNVGKLVPQEETPLQQHLDDDTKKQPEETMDDTLTLNHGDALEQSLTNNDDTAEENHRDLMNSTTQMVDVVFADDVLGSVMTDDLAADSNSDIASDNDEIVKAFDMTGQHQLGSSSALEKPMHGQPQQSMPPFLPDMQNLPRRGMQGPPPGFPPPPPGWLPRNFDLFQGQDPALIAARRLQHSQQMLEASGLFGFGGRPPPPAHPHAPPPRPPFNFSPDFRNTMPPHFTNGPPPPPGMFSTPPPPPHMVRPDNMVSHHHTPPPSMIPGGSSNGLPHHHQQQHHHEPQQQEHQHQHQHQQQHHHQQQQEQPEMTRLRSEFNEMHLPSSSESPQQLQQQLPRSSSQSHASLSFANSSPTPPPFMTGHHPHPHQYHQAQQQPSPSPSPLNGEYQLRNDLRAMLPNASISFGSMGNMINREQSPLSRHQQLQPQQQQQPPNMMMPPGFQQQEQQHPMNSQGNMGDRRQEAQHFFGEFLKKAATHNGEKEQGQDAGVPFHDPAIMSMRVTEREKELESNNNQPPSSSSFGNMPTLLGSSGAPQENGFQPMMRPPPPPPPSFGMSPQQQQQFQHLHQLQQHQHQNEGRGMMMPPPGLFDRLPPGMMPPQDTGNKQPSDLFMQQHRPPPGLFGPGISPHQHAQHQQNLHFQQQQQQRHQQQQQQQQPYPSF